VRRRVALRVIKLRGRLSPASRPSDRQALMDHQHRQSAGCQTDTGRLYFVMELVRGIRITDYDQHKLSTKDRLDLF
jgi:hypothetical protein